MATHVRRLQVVAFCLDLLVYDRAAGAEDVGGEFGWGWVGGVFELVC